ncbi:MAG: tetratricopeptide repeat protein [Candidatus Heimdallarchaeota archaeon]|nr:tetratricopeptide repeat protein [Candidatus Heimdallarchaeota archaeon]MCK4878613.1 tetratricopeptide repeat protein [Candidatus Heimdallarchaeota archaeon]
MREIFAKNLEEIEQLIFRGKYNQALGEIDAVHISEKASKEEKIQCKIFKARIYLIIFPYSKAIKYAEEAYEESREIENKHLMFDSVIILPRAYYYVGEYETIREKTKLANEILDSFADKNTDEYLKRKAIIPLLQGDRFKISFSQLKESVSISEKLGNSILKADSYISLGSKHLWSGNLVEALKYAQKSLGICENIDYHHGAVVALFQKGVIYLQKGELDLAHDCIQQCHVIYKDDLNPYFEACVFINLGLICWLKRDLQTSLEYYQESLTFLKQSKVVSTYHYSSALLRMNDILMEMGRFSEVSQNLKLIEQLYHSKQQYILKKILFLAKARFLKTKSDQISTKEAILLLEEIADDESIILEHHDLVIFHLCDLYLKEITKSNDLETFEKLKHRVTTLNEMAEQQKSYILLAQSLLIQSKLELVEFNVIKGQLLLEKAQKIAEEKGITYLAKVISNEYDILLTQLSTWQEMSSYFPSLEERFEFTHLEDLLTKMIKNNAVYINFQDESEHPYFFLIMTKKGNIVFSEVFGDFSLDEELLQGVLTSINESISSQSLENDTIKRIMYQNFTVAITPLEDVFLVYTFVGQSYTAMRKLKSFSNEFSAFTNKWGEYSKKFITNQELNLHERMEITNFLETVFATD